MENSSPHPIRTERLRQKLTQQQLADRAEVSKYVVCRVECGHTTPRRSTLKALALALGVTPAQLRG